jgi:hypothetical protein
MARFTKTIKNDEGRRVRITFATDNAAFEDYADERGRLVRKARQRNRDGETEGRLMDTNGNTVGGFREIRG